MDRSLELRRVGIFLALAFSIAWATALFIYLTGGLVHSRALIPGTRITVAAILLPTFYMYSPAIAHVLVRLVTREGWSGVFLRPRLRYGWRFWVLAWVLPVLFTLAGATAYFAIFPGHFDASFGAFREQVERAARTSGQPVPISPGILLTIQILSALLIAPIINCLATFGEEFGWRTYLLPKLLPMGFRKAMVAMGIIWGVWHWPLIAMGYEYGSRYPGAPWVGMVSFLWFTFIVGTLLGWLALRGGSVWPAVIAHATVNAAAALPVLFAVGNSSLLIGPLPIGIVGSVGWAVAALLILWRQPTAKPDQFADGS